MKKKNTKSRIIKEQNIQNLLIIFAKPSNTIKAVELNLKSNCIFSQ